jgi:hypothetical protein
MKGIDPGYVRHSVTDISDISVIRALWGFS